MTVSQARRDYTMICNLIGDLILKQGVSEKDPAVLSLRAAAAYLGEKYLGIDPNEEVDD